MSDDLKLSKILVVDDDIHICNLITRFLTQKNFELKFAREGKTALNIFTEFLPDLVILDINLPDILGYHLCEQMQQINNVYVLMLTSRIDVEDKKRGFNQGADDYLTKPFDIEELFFRVQALLKRNRNNNKKFPSSKPLQINNLTIDTEERTVKVNNSFINLTSLEFDLLYFLATNPNKVWRREELMENVWKGSILGDARVVDVHIGQIRSKVELNPRQPSCILTVRGIGYKFQKN